MLPRVLCPDPPSSRVLQVSSAAPPPVPPRAPEHLDLATRASKFHCLASLKLLAQDAEAMRPAKPRALLPALLLLTLALSGTQGRPRGRRASGGAELRLQLFLPMTGTPGASRSAGKPCPPLTCPFLSLPTLTAGQAHVGKHTN